MTLPIEFSFEGTDIRVLMIESNPWWVATDICKVLGQSNTSKALQSLDADERSNFKLGRQGEVNVINESGLYTLILRSREAVTPGSAAHRFRKWVTSDVLPSLRKHGAYVMPNTEDVNSTHTPAEAPMAVHIEADQVVSAGRVFRALFTTARSMGMARRLAATRANQAAERATGVDLAAELGASAWLEGADLPAPHRKHYELQQNLRAHLVANNWPHAVTTQQVIEAMSLTLDKGTQMAVGQCLQLLGYKRTRTGSTSSNSPRPYFYVLSQPGLELGVAA